MKIDITGTVLTDAKSGEEVHFIPTELSFCTKDCEDVFDVDEDECLILSGESIEAKVDYDYSEGEERLWSATWKGVNKEEFHDAKELDDGVEIMKDIAKKKMSLRGIEGRCNKKVLSLKVEHCSIDDGKTWNSIPVDDVELEFQNDEE